MRIDTREGHGTRLDRRDRPPAMNDQGGPRRGATERTKEHFS